MSIPFKHTIPTAGDGLWSGEARDVSVTELQLSAYSDESAELRVYFDTSTWDIEEHGLIYTDGINTQDGFEQKLASKLNELGLPGSDIGYSEQGMQGDDYVSLDAGAEFIAAWEQAGHEFDGDYRDED